MTDRKEPPLRNRRDIGRVETLMDKMLAARELSSCCVGVEAALEANRNVRVAEGAPADGEKPRGK
jgi:hypothetical protein